MSEDRLIVISSDGHATSRMEDYREYLPSEWHERFDRFCVEYREKGGCKNYEPPALNARTDQDVVDDWVENVMEPGRLEGDWDPEARLGEMESVGVVAEVLFTDFRPAVRALWPVPSGVPWLPWPDARGDRGR